ncbi:GIY-YIG nuclease superfamily protein [Edwardsiella piscicida]|nr:GIY-YIG nuclease superfamily protein [Edwardsiella piscicida]
MAANVSSLLIPSPTAAPGLVPGAAVAYTDPSVSHREIPMQNTVAHNGWYLYMLRTAGGALYTGITTDVARRLRQHQSGRGAKALRGKGPLTLAYQCALSRELAARLEYCVNQLSKKQKERLVADQPLHLLPWLANGGYLTSSGKSYSPAQNVPASAATAPYPPG